jgi:hypothetical protein
VLLLERVAANRTAVIFEKEILAGRSSRAYIFHSLPRRSSMNCLRRALKRAARPATALVLAFAQAAAAFGFPLLLPNKIVKPCGCVTPCGAASENCCCARAKACPAPIAAPKPAGCPKCRDRGAAAEKPELKWVAAFKARLCRGETSTGALAELPALPPTISAVLPAAPIASEMLFLSDSLLASHISPRLDPPPRCA